MTCARLTVFIFTVIFAASFVPALSQPGQLPPLDLDTLVEIAREENPEIQALRKRTDALERRVPQAGSLDDPMVGVEASNVPISGLALDETPMSGIQFVAKQKVPYPGKLRLREEIAGHTAGASDAEYRERINTIVGRVKRAYLDYYFINQAILTTEENKKVLEYFVEITDVRYAVGQAPQQDTLKARVELAKIVDELLKLRKQQETARARINNLINRPPQAPLGKPAGFERHEVDYSLEELEQLGVEHRPILDLYRENVARSAAARDLAEKDLKPDFEFGVGYRARSRAAGDPVPGTDFWSASVMVNLPIYARTKQRERIKEEEANQELWEAEFESAKNDTFFQIKDLMAEIEKTGKQVDLFKTGIIPQAELALESSLSEYQVGKTDFLTLLDNELKLYNYQIEYYRALTDYEKAVSDLEATVGARVY
ncbi:MAG: TolC family protein [Armatimonadetes bacterium]|nr:TolC family protein [Armatimonadota bacterium]